MGAEEDGSRRGHRGCLGDRGFYWTLPPERETTASLFMLSFAFAEIAVIWNYMHRGPRKQKAVVVYSALLMFMEGSLWRGDWKIDS